MEKITETFEVYPFNELSPEVQKKVIEREQQDPTRLDYPWHESDIEEFVEKVNLIGFDTTADEVFYSGFWSQGDGACFDGKLDAQVYMDHFNLQDKYPLAYKVAEKGYVWGSIHKNHYANHYSHERTRYFKIETESEDSIVSDVFNDNDTILDKLRDELTLLEKDVEDTREQLSDELYRTLEKSYDHLNSEEVIRENLMSNECYYFIDGRIYG